MLISSVLVLLSVFVDHDFSLFSIRLVCVSVSDKAHVK